MGRLGVLEAEARDGGVLCVHAREAGGGAWLGLALGLGLELKLGPGLGLGLGLGLANLRPHVRGG